MDNRTIEESRNERVVKKSGMYVALVICMLALILGFWSAINRTSRLTAANNARPTVGVSTEKVTKNRAERVEQNQTRVAAPTEAKKPTEAADEETAVSPVATFFTMPVGGEIIKGFSKTELQYSKTYLDWRLHCGVDIAADKGTEVHAAGNGKVRDIYEDKLLGNVIEIDHGNGITAHYCGVGTPLVKIGQTVVAGKTIGGLGSVPCESVDKYHLHFAVMKDGDWVDPIAVMKLS
ncbi:MAG: peptidoglycan DD-metalloendopeptidase family protein [Acutalibacteraceae bacterium]